MPLTPDLTKQRIRSRAVVRVLRLIAAFTSLILIASACSASIDSTSASTGDRGDAVADVNGGDEATDSGAGDSAGETETADTSPADDDVFVVAVVMPTSADDRGFSQSLVDGLQNLREAGDIDEIRITDNTVLDEEASDIIEDWATGGVDLIIGHGPQYGGLIAQTAAAYPDLSFAWGYGDETFGLDNVTAYNAAAGEAAYVMGHVAARLIGEGSVALIGPSQVGDDQAFIEGFFIGVAASGAEMDVAMHYIESYIDIDVARERATESVLNEADVLVSTSGISPGVIEVAAANDLPYFGNQVDNADLASDQVVASQLYRWDVLFREVIVGIKAGDAGGEALQLNLANEGIVISYNPDFDLSVDILQEADALTEDVKAGGIDLTLGDP